MTLRVSLALTIYFVCVNAPSAFGQFKAPKKKADIGPAIGPARVVDDTQGAPVTPFMVTLEERGKTRKVFLPYRDVAAAGREPYAATVYAFRRIQGDEPAKEYLYIYLAQGKTREFPEEDVRKIVLFKKDFAKKVAPIPEHVESASLTLSCHGLTLNFNVKTGECHSNQFQIPDGFFDALSDALGDLEKLKAAKPSFQVK